VRKCRHGSTRLDQIVAKLALKVTLHALRLNGFCFNYRTDAIGGLRRREPDRCRAGLICPEIPSKLSDQSSTPKEFEDAAVPNQ
jgi:uncharacterized Zn finger protein